MTTILHSKYLHNTSRRERASKLGVVGFDLDWRSLTGPRLATAGWQTTMSGSPRSRSIDTVLSGKHCKHILKRERGSVAPRLSPLQRSADTAMSLW